MAPDRHSYGLGILDMRTFTADSLDHYLGNTLATSGSARLLLAQEDLINRYARLPRAAELQLDVMSVAQRLQERYDLEAKSAHHLDLVGRLGSDVVSDALWRASRVSAFELAIDKMVSAFHEEQRLDRLGLVGYTLGLIENYIGGENYAQRLAAKLAGSAASAATLYDRYASYTDYSPEFLAEVQEEVLSYDRVDLDFDEDADDLGAKSAKTQALEGVVAKLVHLPRERGHSLSSERVALISVCLALVFGLLDQLKWYLDALERRHEAAESVLEQEVLAGRHQEAMETEARLSRAMDLLIAQALSQDTYVVRRPVAVRSRPGGGLMLGTAYPNQEVKITGKHSRWFKVHFRDHNEGREIEGWVLKHHLNPMDNTTEPESAVSESKGR